MAWKIRVSLLPGHTSKREHLKIVSDTDGLGVKLIQHEIFSGVLVPFMKKSIHAAKRDIQMKNVEIREKTENIG